VRSYGSSLGPSGESECNGASRTTHLRTVPQEPKTVQWLPTVGHRRKASFEAAERLFALSTLNPSFIISQRTVGRLWYGSGAMNERPMNLDEWLDAFGAFSEEEVNQAIEAANKEAGELQARLEALHTRRASLQVLLEARTKARESQEAPRPTPHERAPTFGDVLTRRAANGTSQAILDLMRTNPGAEWSIADILEGLKERDRLPSSKDPRRAVDATLHRLTNATHELERRGRGVYRLAPSLLNQEIGAKDG
jgi:hypothetical protein